MLGEKLNREEASEITRDKSQEDVEYGGGFHAFDVGVIELERLDHL